MRSTILFILFHLVSCTTPAPADKEIHLTMNGNEIQLRVTGEGAPIIFAHGGYLDLEMWEPQVSRFRIRMSSSDSPTSVMVRR